MCTLDATGVSPSAGDTVRSPLWCNLQFRLHAHTHSPKKVGLVWAAEVQVWLHQGVLWLRSSNFWGGRRRRHKILGARMRRRKDDLPRVNSQIPFNLFWTVADADQVAKQVWKDKYYYGVWREDPNKYINNNKYCWENVGIKKFKWRNRWIINRTFKVNGSRQQLHKY